MRAEGHALFGNLSQPRQRKHLEPAAVGQHRAIPMHEFMQSARLAHELLAGTQMQVIRVGKNNLRAARLYVFRRHRLYGRLRADGHIARRLNIAVRRMHHAAARHGCFAALEQIKRKILTHILLPCDCLLPVYIFRKKNASSLFSLWTDWI